MANDESKTTEETVTEETDENAKKKPAVKGKRLTTGVRGGYTRSGGGGMLTIDCPNTTGGTGWGCTNMCNHAARTR